MPLIYKFIGKSFQINFINIVIISFAFLLNGFYKMLVNYLFYTKKTFYVALGTIIALLFNLVLNYYFIIQFKILGASIALFLTFFLHFLIFLFLVNMNFKLPWFYFINSNKLHTMRKIYKYLMSLFLLSLLN
jgi:O-antigen/teichoic acid export membrane protein